MTYLNPNCCIPPARATVKLGVVNLSLEMQINTHPSTAGFVFVFTTLCYDCSPPKYPIPNTNDCCNICSCKGLGRRGNRKLPRRCCMGGHRRGSLSFSRVMATVCMCNNNSVQLEGPYPCFVAIAVSNDDAVLSFSCRPCLGLAFSCSTMRRPSVGPRTRTHYLLSL